jgi:hypothetical protein
MGRMARPDSAEAPTPHAPRWPEADAQAVLLVATVEAADDGGRLLPYAERARATPAAPAGDPREDDAAVAAAVAARARRSVEAPERGGWRTLLRATRVGAGLWPLAVGVALVGGFLSNALGPARHVSVLSLPLLGVLLWNLVVYAALLLRPVLRPGLGAVPRALLARGARWADRAGRQLLPSPGAGADDRARAAETGGRYVAAWLGSTAPLAGARVRTILHAASAAFALAVVLGMYGRGLAFEYRATWESTFLSADAAQAFVDAVLAPASAVTGIAVPRLEPLRAPATGDAAPWIHLWAATAVSFVVLPRLALALASGARARALAASVAVRLPAGYLRRASGLATRVPARVAVYPYAAGLTARAAEALLGALHDAMGDASDVRLLEALAYGDEALPPPPWNGRASDGAPRVRAIVFSLAQPPEPEVHGKVARDAAASLRPGEALLAVVDASGYRAAGAPSDRVAERRRAWESVLADGGAVAVQADLGGAPDPGLAERLAAAVERAAGAAS